MEPGLWPLLVFAFFLTHGLSAQEQHAPNITDLTFKNMDFAMDLYRKISTHHDSNIFFSPLSVSTAFTVLLLGTGGATRDQILKGLNLAQLEKDNSGELISELFQHLLTNITQDGTFKLQQATALFVGMDVHVDVAFSTQINQYFGADICNVDFGKPKVATETINEYVGKHTGNKVKEILITTEPLTKLMLINTIFFQGGWELPFNPNNTENARFYVDKYKIVQVPMMFKEDKFYMATDENLKVKVLRLSYLGGTAMLIVLPNRDVDYTEIDEEITAAKILHWNKKMVKVKLEVQLPKFKMEQSYAMQKILPDLGIGNIFQDTANLTRLSMEAGLKVSEVCQTVIEVDERGTTAAAATTVGITAYSLPRTFIVNRPFFFFIYHELTNSLLFMGRVIDPTKK
uniref:Serpin domain-containing protein n=1 Tax=Denticeps clupeoides TaxID=299321 RepID=A0AAY4AT30_9TELE